MNIKRDYIPIDQCVNRGVYRIHSRNLSVGVYCPESQGFVGIREKFGTRYLFTEYHYDTGASFGTVFPKEQIDYLPADIHCHELVPHEFGGHSFAIDPATNAERPVVRHALAAGEEPHGTRHGFVDEWAGTGERLPEGVWTHVKQNQVLFDFLDAIEQEELKTKKVAGA